MALTFIALCAGTVISSYFAWQASERADSESNAKRAAQSAGERATQLAKAEQDASKLAREREQQATAAAQLAHTKELEAIEAAKQEKSARDLAEAKQREVTAAQEEVARKAKELESQVYRGKISLAHRELQARNVPRAIQILQETDPVPPRLGMELLLADCNMVLNPFSGQIPYEPIVGVDFRPDGVQIASAGINGFVMVRDAVTGNQIFRVQVPREELYSVSMRLGIVRWTPDGSKLVVAGLDNKIKLLDGQNGTILGSLEGFQRGGVVHRGQSLMENTWLVAEDRRGISIRTKSACMNWRPASWFRDCWATRTSPMALRSAPTAACWHRPRRIISSSCGIPRPVRNCGR